MGTVTLLDKEAEHLVTLLRKLAQDASEGRITGAIILAEYEDDILLEVPGVFSQEPHNLATIVGHLQVASTIFSNMAALPDLE